MNDIHYTKGDATQPSTSGNKIIVHICNDVGGWGRGFVMAISKRWPEPEQQYRQWFQSKKNFELGEVQFVKVEDDLWVANMIGQHNLSKDEKGNPPIRYNAVQSGLAKVADFALSKKATVHMPRIGCGLAGGTWDKIEPLIEDTLVKKNVEVTVYDF
jgi:O-acetyl-ADP-ribose deacetylase (regulator of RNase III)